MTKKKSKKKIRKNRNPLKMDSSRTKKSRRRRIQKRMLRLRSQSRGPEPIEPENQKLAAEKTAGL
jgi:hypothetical protein